MTDLEWRWRPAKRRKQSDASKALAKRVSANKQRAKRQEWDRQKAEEQREIRRRNNAPIS
jgi:hypothetical protein